MNFRLTYALDEETVFTAVLATEKTDIHGAYEDAIQYVEEEHGSEESLNLIAFSIMLLSDENAN